MNIDKASAVTFSLSATFMTIAAIGNGSLSAWSAAFFAWVSAFLAWRITAIRKEAP